MFGWLFGSFCLLLSTLRDSLCHQSFWIYFCILPFIRKCPYISRVLAAAGVPLDTTRLWRQVLDKPSWTEETHEEPILALGPQNKQATMAAVVSFPVMTETKTRTNKQKRQLCKKGLSGRLSPIVLVNVVDQNNGLSLFWMSIGRCQV
jgi:hypothetical protein